MKQLYTLPWALGIGKGMSRHYGPTSFRVPTQELGRSSSPKMLPEMHIERMHTYELQSSDITIDTSQENRASSIIFDSLMGQMRFYVRTCMNPNPSACRAGVMGGHRQGWRGFANLHSFVACACEEAPRVSTTKCLKLATPKTQKIFLSTLIIHVIWSFFHLASQ